MAAGLLVSVAACRPSPTLPTNPLTPSGKPGGLTTSAASSATIGDSHRPAVFTRVAAGALLSYRFRAARFSNLFYFVDCLAGVAACSSPAFEALAKDDLGGLDAEDRAALKIWKDIRRSYRGKIERRDEADSSLPLPRSHRQVERRVRLPGYTSSSSTEYASRLGLFVDEVDAGAGKAILDRFTVRFDRYWDRAEPVLEPLVAGFAAEMAAPRLSSLVDSIEAFYGPTLPTHTEITFDLILRPASDRSSAEQLAQFSLVEVTPGEKPEERLDVVLHELFHFFLSQVDGKKMGAQVERFATSDDALAYPAFGAMDEALASAFGNGLVLRLLDPAAFARRAARKQGLYAEDVIDALAKAAVPRLEAELGHGSRVTEPDLMRVWLDVARAAYPSGFPPVARLRPFACIYPSELEDAMPTLYAVSKAAQTSSSSSLDFAESRSVFADKPRWTRVLLLRTADVPLLGRWHDFVSPAAIREVTRAAHNQTSFVYGETRTLTTSAAPTASSPPAATPTTFVLVAKDSIGMKALLERFARIETMRDGILTE